MKCYKQTRPLVEILKTARSITISPISYKDDSDSLLDFNCEMISYKNGFSVMWDDAPSNDSQVGDLFAFISGQGRKETDLKTIGMPDGYCQLRYIEAVYPDNHRPKGIWKIPEHEGRHVLGLSDIVYEGTWIELCEATGREAWGKVLTSVLDDGTEVETRVASPRQGTLRWKLS